MISFLLCIISVHRKTNEQVRKLRPQIQTKQVSADDIARSKNPPSKHVEEKPYDQDRVRSTIICKHKKRFILKVKINHILLFRNESS